MNSQKLLQDLRELYLKKDFDGLRRKYYLSKAFLQKEDCDKIERVLEIEKARVVSFALEHFGGRAYEIKDI